MVYFDNFDICLSIHVSLSLQDKHTWIFQRGAERMIRGAEKHHPLRVQIAPFGR